MNQGSLDVGFKGACAVACLAGSSIETGELIQSMPILDSHVQHSLRVGHTKIGS